MIVVVLVVCFAVYDSYFLAPYAYGMRRNDTHRNLVSRLRQKARLEQSAAVDMA